MTGIKIFWQFFLSVAMVILLGVVGAFVLISGLKQSISHLDHLYNNEVSLVVSMQELSRRFTNHSLMLYRHVDAESSTAMDFHFSELSGQRLLLNAALDSAKDSGLLENSLILSKLTALTANYFEKAGEAVEKSRSFEKKEAAGILRVEVGNILSQINQLIGELVITESRSMESQYRKSIGLQKKTLALASGAGLAALFVSLGIAVFFARLLSLRIKAIILSVEKFGNGDLSVRIASDARDEIGSLAQGFNMMADRLKSAFSDLKWSNALHEKRALELEVSKAMLQQKQAELITLNNQIESEHARLKEATDSLTRIMLRVADGGDISIRVNNSNLVKCWEENNCSNMSCSLRLEPEAVRCWELKNEECSILNKQGGVVVRHCRECSVYTHSRQDEIQAIGETFNDMMAILEKRQLELGEARRLAEQSVEAKGQFLANMSHEIRTPMNGVLGMTELALATELTDKQRNYLEFVNQSAIRLLGVIDDILDFSKIEAGKIVLRPVEFNLVDLLTELIQMFHLGAKEKNISLKYSLQDEAPYLLIGDSGRLLQVLINLLGNAIKFTEKGEIELSVSVRGNAKDETVLTFSVMDTGMGIPSGAIRKIFNAFEQADGSMTRSHGGTGLGLSIASKLVALMGGRIWVESEEGKGSVFSFTARFAQQKLALASEGRDDDSKLPKIADQTHFVDRLANIDLKGMHILLAEDDVVNRMVAESNIEELGCRVTSAANGEEAVNAFAGDAFDLILMDIQMPVMNGMIATQLIRKELKLSTPIIAFTANAIDSEISKYMSFGMEDFIVKPYREIELYEKIEKFTRINITNMNAEKTNAKLYDLTYLNELSQGDESFTQQIIEAFLVMAEQSIEQLRLAQAGNDIAVVRKIAHKIKPTLANFQVTSIKSLIDKLNQADSGSINEAELKMDVDKVIDILTTIQKGLKDELK